jgi:hypothetical protein
MIACSDPAAYPQQRVVHGRIEVLESAPEHWLRIVHTNLPSPNDFSEAGLPLQQLTYEVAPDPSWYCAQNKMFCSREARILS